MTDATFSRPGAVDLSSLSQSASTNGGSYVTAVTEAEFQALAGQSMQHPVIVEFYSNQAPQGAQVSDALAELVNAAQGRFLLARVDVDAEPRLAQALGVQAVPTVIALIGGQLAPLFQGTADRADIAAMLDQLAQVAVANGLTGRAQSVASAEAAGESAQVNQRFAKADAALAAGDYQKALEEFDVLVKETPNDAEVLAGRAQAGLLVRSATLDSQAVMAKAAAEPSDVEAQLAAADLEIISGHYEQAFDRLLGLAAEVGAEERDPIRVRLLELFEVVGRTEPAVLKARRRLASVLF